MHKHTDPASAAAELLNRRSIRNSLTKWARHKGFEPAPHHQLFIREIEAFLQGEDEVLLLFAPPGSAKSTYVSVLLPSWYLLQTQPTASHNVEFAERWQTCSQRHCGRCERTWHLSVGGQQGGRTLVSELGGEYYGLGAGVGISGFRANLGVGDALGRMPTATLSGRSAGIGMWMTSQRV
jgi:hypothetical protein